MSVSYWADDLATIKEEEVEKRCPQEYLKFKKAINKYGVDLDTFGRYWEWLEHDELFRDSDIEVKNEEKVVNKINDTFEKLEKRFMEVTGLTLSVRGGGYDTMTKDYVGFVIEDFFIINPKVTKDMRAIIFNQQVIQGG